MQQLVYNACLYLGSKSVVKRLMEIIVMMVKDLGPSATTKEGHYNYVIANTDRLY